MRINDPMHCGRKTRGDYPCKNKPMLGQSVCRMHGGSSPQALRKAEERLRDLVDPSISRLAQLIVRADSDSVSLNAVRYVLDWAGYKPATDGAPDQPSVHVTVLFDRADDQSSTIALPNTD